jgi:hypothetical protein
MSEKSYTDYSLCSYLSYFPAFSELETINIPSAASKTCPLKRRFGFLVVFSEWLPRSFAASIQDNTGIKLIRHAHGQGFLELQDP